LAYANTLRARRSFSEKAEGLGKVTDSLGKVLGADWLMGNKESEKKE
jgi:hypothetical protein